MTWVYEIRKQPNNISYRKHLGFLDGFVYMLLYNDNISYRKHLGFLDGFVYMLLWATCIQSHLGNLGVFYRKYYHCRATCIQSHLGNLGVFYRKYYHCRATNQLSDTMCTLKLFILTPILLFYNFQNNRSNFKVEKNNFKNWKRAETLRYTLILYDSLTDFWKGDTVTV
jgi:hypothetical protein